MQKNAISTWLVLGPIYNKAHQTPSHDMHDRHPMAEAIISDIENNPLKPADLTDPNKTLPREGDTAIYGNGTHFPRQTYTWRVLSFANPDWGNIHYIEDDIHHSLGGGQLPPDPDDPLSFTGKHHCLAFFLTAIESPVSRTAKLCVMSDDSIRVWLNGKEVHELACIGEQNITEQSTETCADISLLPGRNVLMAAVAETHVEWGLFARIEVDQGPNPTLSICRDERRRGGILAHPSLNGIDFVEYQYRPEEKYPHVLVVNFLKPLPEPPHSDPDGAYGLTTHLHYILMVGGVRIVGIRALAAHVQDGALEIGISEAGDFSDYQLLLGWERQADGQLARKIDNLDPALSVATVNFKIGCPVEFDCRAVEVCPPEPPEEPAIDYLAKDYASFRQLLLDRIPLLNPDWIERNPADLGMAIVELLAYAGDHLSYFQDAVATEAFLDTARQRVSAKRHARLVDYRMHDGRNAWTYVHLGAPSSVVVRPGTMLLSRITAPLRGQAGLPKPVIPATDLSQDTFDSDPALANCQVFETAFQLEAHLENNEIFLHTWGNHECCLPRGVTSADLYAVLSDKAVSDKAVSDKAVRPMLHAGDYLLLEEVRGPQTGLSADADPDHRQVVQLIQVDDRTEDPLFSDVISEGQPQPWQPGQQPLPLLTVTWRRTDALVFPLCLSARPPGQQELIHISVARGNIVLADHGRTVREVIPLAEPIASDSRFRPVLGRGPLTMQCQPPAVKYDLETGLLASQRFALDGPVREAQPAVAAELAFPTGTKVWQPVPHLLDSSPFDEHFVVDIHNDGRAELRFGDGEYGREPVGATSITVVYRVGNGRTGNLGAEALFHIVQPLDATNWLLRNPLPARDGTDPETIEAVRQYAPAAFRTEQFRAVTEADYAAAAGKLPGVSRAVASFRWTGSWYTVFVGIDPSDPDAVITEPGGQTHLSLDLEQRVRAALSRFRIAGYDLEVLCGQYVPLEIELHLCVAAGHFRDDVVRAVQQALSNRVGDGGQLGFFHPDNVTFGQPVFLSQLFATVEAVAGVDSVTITRFQRFGKKASGELEAGMLPIGAWEIARLDNDPNFMENGVLRIHADGGK